MKIGDRIFYQKNGEFYIDRIADIEIIDGKSIYQLVRKENNVMDINYAELYSVKPNESDFSCAIKRSLKNGVIHISENFITTINDIRNKRARTVMKGYTDIQQSKKLAEFLPLENLF